MFGRFFDSFKTRFATRGSRSAVNGHARMYSCSDCACAENMNSLLNLDTVIAVSIFAALRLIIIRIARIAASIIVLVAAVVVARRSNTEPGMVPAH